MTELNLGFSSADIDPDLVGTAFKVSPPAFTCSLPEMKFSCVGNITSNVIYGSVCQRLSAPSTFSMTTHPLKCGPCIISAFSRTIYHDDEDGDQDTRHMCCADR